MKIGRGEPRDTRSLFNRFNLEAIRADCHKSVGQHEIS